MSSNSPLLLDELRRHTRLLESILTIVKNSNGADEEYLTVSETAKMLKRSPTTIRRLIATNKIDGMKINNGSPAIVISFPVILFGGLSRRRECNQQGIATSRNNCGLI